LASLNLNTTLLDEYCDDKLTYNHWSFKTNLKKKISLRSSNVIYPWDDKTKIFACSSKTTIRNTTSNNFNNLNAVIYVNDAIKLKQSKKQNFIHLLMLTFKSMIHWDARPSFFYNIRSKDKIFWDIDSLFFFSLPFVKSWMFWMFWMLES
jgi:hypothetical protein